MPALPIRTDISARELRRRAKHEKNPRVARRLLAIANALDGMSRALSARLAGMDRQALRDWVIRYNADGLDGLKDRWGEGRPMAVSEGDLAAVKAMILRAALPSGDADRPAYRLVDVARLIEDRTGVRYSISGTHRIMGSLNLSHQKARPAHPQANPRAQHRLQKKFPARPKRIARRKAPGRKIEVWFQDAARCGPRAIIDGCCDAWNAVIAECGRVQPLATLPWASKVNP